MLPFPKYQPLRQNEPNWENGWSPSKSPLRPRSWLIMERTEWRTYMSHRKFPRYWIQNRCNVWLTERMRILCFGACTDHVGCECLRYLHTCRTSGVDRFAWSGTKCCRPEKPVCNYQASNPAFGGLLTFKDTRPPTSGGPGRPPPRLIVQFFCWTTFSRSRWQELILSSRLHNTNCCQTWGYSQRRRKFFNEKSGSDARPHTSVLNRPSLRPAQKFKIFSEYYYYYFDLRIDDSVLVHKFVVTGPNDGEEEAISYRQTNWKDVGCLLWRWETCFLEFCRCQFHQRSC